MLVYSHDHQSHLPDEQGWSIECSRVWHLLQKEYQLLKEDESNWTWKRKSHLWNNIIMIVLMIIISTYQMFMGDALGATGFGSCREGVSVAEWRYVPPKWRGMYCSLWNDIIMPALDDHESHLSDVQGLAAAVNRNISCCRKMSPLSSLQVWSVWLEWDLDIHQLLPNCYYTAGLDPMIHVQYSEYSRIKFARHMWRGDALGTVFGSCKERISAAEVGGK